MIRLLRKYGKGQPLLWHWTCCDLPKLWALSMHISTYVLRRSYFADAQAFSSGQAPFSLPFRRRCARISRRRFPTSWRLWKSCRLPTRILHLILSLVRRSTFSHKLPFPCISLNTRYGPIRMRPPKPLLRSRHFRDGLRIVD